MCLIGNRIAQVYQLAFHLYLFIYLFKHTDVSPITALNICTEKLKQCLKKEQKQYYNINYYYLSEYNKN